ncbi:MAG: PspA/IM30 family protein [Caldilineaceae bacterium]|nr:PspA/IM30 family protein [Caldilineaceae bacterium]
MASLLDKVTLLVSANLHDLADQALQSNSLAVIDQYIRQVEGNMAELEDAAAAVGGEARALERKRMDYERQRDELDRAIDIFLVDGNEAAATAAQSRLNSTQRLLESYQDQTEQQIKEFQSLLDAKVKLEARLAAMRQEREELRALLQLAKSKEITVKAIKSLDDLAGSGDSDISNIAAGINARLDKATVAVAMRTASLDAQIDKALAGSELDAQLAERRKRLGLNDE